MAGFDYNAALNAVVQALKDSNTTTSTTPLSNGLTTPLDSANIVKGDPSVTRVRQDRLPAIFVRISNASEDFLDIGATGPTGNSKQKDVVFDIFAMYQKEGAQADYASVLDAIGKLAQNIESVFQREFRLSGTAMWCQVKSTAIANVPIDSDGSTWVKTALLELEARYFFR